MTEGNGKFYETEILTRIAKLRIGMKIPQIEQILGVPSKITQGFSVDGYSYDFGNGWKLHHLGPELERLAELEANGHTLMLDLQFNKSPGA